MKYFKKYFAEKEGFEPPDLLQSTVFKTAAFDRSAISPISRFQYLIASANIARFFDYQNILGLKNKENFTFGFNRFIFFYLQAKHLQIIFHDIVKVT